MGRGSDEGRLERYEELIPEYPEGIRASQLARLQGVARSTVQRDLPALREADGSFGMFPSLFEKEPENEMAGTELPRDLPFLPSRLPLQSRQGSRVAQGRIGRGKLRRTPPARGLRMEAHR